MDEPGVREKQRLERELRYQERSDRTVRLDLEEERRRLQQERQALEREMSKMSETSQTDIGLDNRIGSVESTENMRANTVMGDREATQRSVDEDHDKLDFAGSLYSMNEYGGTLSIIDQNYGQYDDESDVTIDIDYVEKEKGTNNSNKMSSTRGIVGEKQEIKKSTTVEKEEKWTSDVQERMKRLLSQTTLAKRHESLTTPSHIRGEEDIDYVEREKGTTNTNKMSSTRGIGREK